MWADHDTLFGRNPIIRMGACESGPNAPGPFFTAVHRRRQHATLMRNGLSMLMHPLGASRAL